MTEPTVDELVDFCRSSAKDTSDEVACNVVIKFHPSSLIDILETSKISSKYDLIIINKIAKQNYGNNTWFDQGLKKKHIRILELYRSRE